MKYIKYIKYYKYYLRLVFKSALDVYFDKIE